MIIWLPILLLTVTIIGVLSIPAIRIAALTRPLYRTMRRSTPSMSQTEQEALQAGSVWWDQQIFSGNPDWSLLQKLPEVKLSNEEQAFLDGPVEQLCDMLNDWEITHHLLDLPDDVWKFIKQHRFFALIIPQHYGGLQFSHYAHSEIVMKIASRCTTAAVTIMVPNSLGPAKLLLEYGTQQQKDYYLPRLADGREFPCFALTGPEAGSDASAMPDNGILCKQAFNGKKDVLGIRLNWEKRYITLGPVATVLGLAFKLYDPNHLIGNNVEIGITVALIPTDTPGVQIGKRHYPLNSAFQNGPNQGKDVFIPVGWIIGGVTQAGNGWKMLMQCLAVGRAISLPALSTSAAKFTSRNCGAYARIRKQFNRPIGEFEGVAEALANIAGETYTLNAMRQITLAALDNGEKPAVISAIIKYQATEKMRTIVNHGMDILGGAGICMGPRNFLGRLYQVIPVAITVEGANILTRSMMIFGQGIMRCHPFLQQEFASLQNSDEQQGIREFDKLFMTHLCFFAKNLMRANLPGMNTTSGKMSTLPECKTYYQQINRYSCLFASLTDIALLSHGGNLKKKERLSGYFADALSQLYLCSCILRYYEQEDKTPNANILMHWACQQALYQCQQALLKVCALLPYQSIMAVYKLVVFRVWRSPSAPGQQLTLQTAQILMQNNAERDRLTQGIYINKQSQDATGRLEVAFTAILNALPAEQKIKYAQKQQQLPKGNIADIIPLALKHKIISQNENILLLHAEQSRKAAIAVDAFDEQELHSVNNSWLKQ